MVDMTKTAAMVTTITSRDNPMFKELRRLVQDNSAYKKQARIWIEGDHLCRAAIARGHTPALAVFPESNWPPSLVDIAQVATKTVVIPDRLFKDLSALESPSNVAYVLDLPSLNAILPEVPTVILDRVQDAGNVGSILRSAAAFGFHQVLALAGTAALWSPKVVRAGMGAHFGLTLHEGLEAADLDALTLPLFATSSHTGNLIHQQVFPQPYAWVFGHEGQGVSAALQARAAHTVRIAQPGGEESLNVAAAAAICLHASAISTLR